MKRLLLLASVGALVFLLAFAVSTNVSAAQQKTKAVAAQKGWLGVAIQDISSEMKKEKNLDSRDGALVNEVTRKSPAEAAGIEEGDVIVQFGGKKIEDASDLQEAVRETKPETKVGVVVVRKGEKKTLDVVIGKQKAGRSIVSVLPRGARAFSVFTDRNTQGMSLREMNEQMAQYFSLSDGPGVLVWEVEKGSAAEKAGLKAGDVITMVGKKKIKQVRDVYRALGIYDEGEKAEIEVLRKGSRQTLSLEIAEGGEDTGYQYWFDSPSSGRDLLFKGGTFDIHVPRIEVDRIGPDLNRLRIEVDHLKERIREDASGLRERIEREVRPHVRVRIEREA